MKYLPFILLLLFSTCKREPWDCPYEFASTTFHGHCLKIPITFSPHQMSYRVGDTIHISTIFTDSIEDICAQTTFKVQDFPFKPITLLYRFHGGENWDAGYRVNELIIDSAYQHEYNYSSEYADGFKSYTIYENGTYRFEFDLVLKEPGRYIFLMTDLYNEQNATGNAELNEEANAVNFEGDCESSRTIFNIIEGDDHLDLFEAELIILEEKVYEGDLASIENYTFGVLGPGRIRMEFNGFFGFEVLE